MGKKLRQGKPWMQGFRYGALLPALSINLIVTDVETSVKYYQAVFNAEAHYYDVDFGAIRVGPAEVMLHADHTHNEHPWHEDTQGGAKRGVGAQFRLLGIDPDQIQANAETYTDGQLISPATDKGHGWREVLVRDPDGYEWAVGVLIPPAKGPLQPTQDE